MIRQPSIIKKPWGIEEIWSNAPNYIGKILTINANQRLSRKYHRVRNHTIRILEGTLTVEVGPFEAKGEITEIKLTPGNAYHVPPMVIHRFCAGSEGVVLAEVSNAGASDAVRLEDDYRRVTDIPQDIKASGK